jgi:prolyl oligopeptidase
MKRLLFAVAVLAGFSATATALEYPKTRQADVTDDYHGVSVADPYRWLEDTESRETRNWIRAQNQLSLPFLRKLPERANLHRRLTEVWNHERYGLPRRVDGRLFYTRNDGLQNQSVLYVKDGPDQAPRVLLDPNRLDAAGTTALTQWKVSPDGQYVAYGLARAGSDWNEFRVLRVDTGTDTGDVLQRIKFSNLSWTKDSKGFFYARYPDPPKSRGGGVFEDLAHQKLYYHRVGTPQREDVLIFERPDEPQWGFDAEVSDDGLFVFIRVWRGASSENALYYKYLRHPETPDLDGPVAALVTGFSASYEPVGNEGSVLYLLTDSRAPRKRIIAVDLRAPAVEHWVTLVQESDAPIARAVLAGRQFVLVTMQDAADRVRRYSLSGKRLPDFELPGLGALSRPGGNPQIEGDPRRSELFLSYTSFSRPATNFRCDTDTGRCAEFQPLRLAFNPDDYVTEQVFYRSKDGTRIPMFISYRKGWSRQKDGPRPTLLYGYGGFDIALTPEYRAPVLAWMEQGGVFAQANLRGGGEYGKAWHQAGIKTRRQNVFNDFIAAAEYLVKSRYTSTAQLAIYGRSNGGLLVGTVLNQRPDLFAAALPAVGVMDMLRYHRFTIGWAWAPDYGTADDPREFRALHAYSPYHNVKPGTKYPAVLVTTADHDDRVVPGHSFKYAAALQAAQAGARPVLIRIETQAGHGAGKPVSKDIEEWADQLAFITEFTKTAP